MIAYLILFLVSVTIASFSQILLKKSASIKQDYKVKEYFNKYVIISYVLLISTTILTAIAYKGINLAFGAVLESFGYVIVTVLARLILKENLSKQKIIGIIIIVTGIVIFAISNR